jgi:serine/threonine protein kinase
MTKRKSAADDTDACKRVQSVSAGAALLDKYLPAAVFVRTLGMGAFGQVLLIRFRGANAAIKIFHPGDESETDCAFEVSVNARVAHTGGPRVITSGSNFIVFEFVDGATVADMLDQHHHFSSNEIREIASQLIVQLGRIHKSGAVHTDLSPKNVLIQGRTDKKEVVAKIIDFGSASFDNAEEPSLTRADYESTTVSSRTPEQCMGLNPSYLSDIYSLALLILAMLRGVMPYPRTSRSQFANCVMLTGIDQNFLTRIEGIVKLHCNLENLQPDMLVRKEPLAPFIARVISSTESTIISQDDAAQWGEFLAPALSFDPLKRPPLNEWMLLIPKNSPLV